MTDVPFTTDAFHGFALVRGLMRSEEAAIQIQFDIVDSITGLARQHVRLAIPKDQIDSVDFQQGIFRRRLRVRVREIQAIDQVPWRVGAEFVVAIGRQDCELAARFVEDVMWSLD